VRDTVIGTNLCYLAISVEHDKKTKTWVKELGRVTSERYAIKYNKEEERSKELQISSDKFFPEALANLSSTIKNNYHGLIIDIPKTYTKKTS